MKRIWRLVRYMRPYGLLVVMSTLLMAVVGAMAAFRILLIKPILDNVLSASESPDKVLRFQIPRTHTVIDLQRLICRTTFTTLGRWWRWRWWRARC